jgi:hypothetical protein
VVSALSWGLIALQTAVWSFATVEAVRAIGRLAWRAAS